MNIYIGGHFDGVCIESYQMPLKTESQIEQIITAFSWAKEKGPTIMNFLKSI